MPEKPNYDQLGFGSGPGSAEERANIKGFAGRANPVPPTTRPNLLTIIMIMLQVRRRRNEEAPDG